MFIDLSDLESTSEDESTTATVTQTKRSMDDGIDLDMFIFGDSSSSDCLAGTLEFRSPQASITCNKVNSSSSDDECSHSDETNHSLACHKGENLPNIAISSHGRLYHADCLKCAQCGNQILPPMCFLQAATPNKTIVLCPECAAGAEKARKVCQVCTHEVEDKDRAVELQRGFFVHNECLHCSCCSRAPPKVTNFSVVEGTQDKHIVCKDCVAILNGTVAKDATGVFIGRLIPEIIPKKFHNNCQRCSRKLKNHVFVFSNS